MRESPKSFSFAASTQLEEKAALLNTELNIFSTSYMLFYHRTTKKKVCRWKMKFVESLLREFRVFILLEWSRVELSLSEVERWRMNEYQQDFICSWSIPKYIYINLNEIMSIFFLSQQINEREVEKRFHRFASSWWSYCVFLRFIQTFVRHLKRAVSRLWII